MRKSKWWIIFAVLIVLMLAAMAAMGGTVDPLCTVTPRPTKTPTKRADTPTPRLTPTLTPVSTPTPTLTHRPTIDRTPTPTYPPFDNPTPTMTAVPAECGQVCIPSFIKVGRYFMLPEISSCGYGEPSILPVWRVEEILPSGWIFCRDEQGQETWVQWTLLKQMIPVWLAGIQ
jgi:hypothetical protein